MALYPCSDEAIALLYEVLPKELSEKYAKQDLYQKYGSYIYLEFRDELSKIYATKGKEAATEFIKNTFGVKK